MKKNTFVKAVAIIGVLALVLGALLPTLAVF